MTQHKRTWVVTGDGSRGIDVLAAALVQAGAEVTSQLDEIGIVIAAGTPAQAQAWRALAGVAAVEADAGIDIGPPDAPVS